MIWVKQRIEDTDYVTKGMVRYVCGKFRIEPIGGGVGIGKNKWHLSVVGKPLGWMFRTLRKAKRYAERNNQ
jgi:hypothetical protein